MGNRSGVVAVAVMVAALAGVKPAGAVPPASVGAPGTRVLVQHVELEGNRAIFPRLLVLEPDGQLWRLVAGQARDGVWSPDGDRVAFLAPILGGTGVELVNADGSGRRLLGPAGALGPQAWSPDGTRLVVTDDQGLRAIDAATGESTALAEGFAGDASWSPDGRSVAYFGETGLRVVEVETGVVRDLAGGMSSQGEAPAWSPDGALVAFRAAEISGEDVAVGVWLVRTDGSELRLLADGASDPHWSPDAAHLAYVVGDSPRVVVARADGSAPAVLPLLTGADHAYAPTWTADGTALILTSGSPGVRALDRVPWPSGEVARLTTFDPRDHVAARVAPGPTRTPVPTTVAAALWWSRQLPDGGAGTVLLSRSDLFADALSSGGLQGALDAPLLLTPGDALHPSVAAELARLGADRVVLLGGTAAVSEAVADELRALGYTVERVAGFSRESTAYWAAQFAFEAPTTIVVARAYGDPAVPSQAFADSLGAGALAAALPAPLLLSESVGLSQVVEEYLAQTPSVTEAILAGGTAALSEEVEQRLVSLGLTVRRAGGATRFDTAAALTRVASSVPGPLGRFVLVDGTSEHAWADGFAAARVAQPAGGGGLLLTAGDELPQATLARLAQVRGVEDVGEFGEATAVRCAPALRFLSCLQTALTPAGASAPPYVAVLTGADRTELAVLHVLDTRICGSTVAPDSTRIALRTGESQAARAVGPVTGCTIATSSFPTPPFVEDLVEGAGTLPVDLTLDGEVVATGTLVAPERAWDLQATDAPTGLLVTHADELCAGVDATGDVTVEELTVHDADGEALATIAFPVPAPSVAACTALPDTLDPAAATILTSAGVATVTAVGRPVPAGS